MRKKRVGCKIIFSVCAFLCSFVMMADMFDQTSKDSLIQTLKNNALQIRYDQENLFTISNYNEVLTRWQSVLADVARYVQAQDAKNKKLQEALTELNKEYGKLRAAVAYAHHALKVGTLEPNVDSNGTLFRQLRTEFDTHIKNMIQLQYTLDKLKKLKPQQQAARDVLWQAAVYVQTIAQRAYSDFIQQPWRTS